MDHGKGQGQAGFQGGSNGARGQDGEQDLKGEREGEEGIGAGRAEVKWDRGWGRTGLPGGNFLGMQAHRWGG